MDKTPCVSIIMNCHNGEQYLREAIDSALAQTFPDWELVFWDNASTQDVSGIVRQYDDPRIRYFRGDEKVPLGRARNFAIEKARGKYIAFLDSDDIWASAKLEKQLRLFDDPEVDIVYSDVESFNARGQRKRQGAKKKLPRGRCFGDLLADYVIVLSSAVVRRSALDRHKIRFREDYDMIEEVDVFLRLAYFGKVDFVDEVLTQWRVHGASGVWSKFHLLADETELMLEEFRRQLPNAAENYAEQFRARAQWVIRQRALALWMKGDGRAARACLLNSPARLPIKVKMLYLASWLDAKRWIPIINRFTGMHVAP